jgi:UV DNA damage endonuclease
MARYGYACISQLTGLTTNHATQLKYSTPDKLRSLIEQNIRDIQAILTHNLAHGWLIFRVGSSFIPFASHPINTLYWWEEYAEPLANIGEFVRANNMRLMMHPGQYTILNSLDEKTRVNAIAELDYSARLFDTMGLSSQNKLVIHIGGVYGDKPAATARFIEQALILPTHIRRRLTIEHEERGYNLADVLRISRETGLPVVYDNLHYDAYPTLESLDELLPQAFATWSASDGPPEVHFSSQAVGARLGSHDEFVDPQQFKEVIERCSRFGDFDLMLEAKGKDEALERVLTATGIQSTLQSLGQKNTD